MLRVLHCSDIHFGRWAVPEQYEALERLIAHSRFDVVAVAGDVTQRARAGEFQRARAFLQRAAEVSSVIVVPGNHDVAWWRAPLGIRDHTLLFQNYRQYIAENLEPVLRVRGATFVGLNSSQGITWDTLTWNYRDLSILGCLTDPQLERARDAFMTVPADDLKVLVVHHNVLPGELSERLGYKRNDVILESLASMEVDLVLCGHDHQEAARLWEGSAGQIVVSTASSIAGPMVRAGRPPAAQEILLNDEAIEVRTLVWSCHQREFRVDQTMHFPRRQRQRQSSTTPPDFR